MRAASTIGRRRHEGSVGPSSARCQQMAEFDTMKSAAYVGAAGQAQPGRHQERAMRTYYDIDLTSRNITKRELHGEEIVRAGRYWIAKTLPRARGGDRRPAVAGESAHLLGRSVRGHELLEREPDERGLQEPAHRRHQGSQRRGQLQLRARTAESRRLHPARRRRRLGGHPLPERRHDRLRRRRAVPGQGQLRGPGDAAQEVRAAKSRSRSAGPSANTRACSAASRSATRTAGRLGCRRAAAWAR